MKKGRYLFLLGSLKKGGAERNLAKVASALSNGQNQIQMILFDRQIDYPLHKDINLTILGIPKGRLQFLNRLALYSRVFAQVWNYKPDYAIGFSRVSSQLLALTFFPRVIGRFDSYPFALKKKRWLPMLLILNFPNVRRVVCPSSEMRDDVKSWFLNRKKLIVISNPVADVSNTADGPMLYEHPRPYFLVMGRLTVQKHVDLIIESYATSKAIEGFDLIIVGDGNQLKKLKQLVESKNLADRVHFKGFIYNPQAVVKGAFMLISASSKEGFPNVLVEALSLGTPVISSDCKTGPKEIIQEGINGYLFPVGDGISMREKVDYVVSNPSVYRNLKDNAQQSVLRFSSEIIIDHWSNLLYKSKP